MKPKLERLKWFSLSQAAEYLGWDRESVRDMVKKKRLRTVRFPGQTWARIPKIDLDGMDRLLERELK